MAAVAAVAGGFAEAAMAPHSACAPSPLQLEEQQGSDFGGAQSGKSETIAEALLHGLHDRAVTPTIPSSQEQLEPTAASAEVQGSTQNSSHDMSSTPVPEAAAEAAAGPQGGIEEGDVDLLVPLSPPDESEGPEAAAEYERYLARWEEGQTLAQRWHRLAQQGKLCDIQEEWEDWQLDLMLTQVKQRTTTALTQQGKAPAGGLNGSLLCSTRLRRGRGEVQEADDSPNEEPRRVRSRRAPATLQDFHVNAAAAAATAKTPERTPEGCDPTHTPAAAAAANGSHSSAGSYRQQQQPSPQTGRDAASEESTDEAADNVRALDQQQQTVGSTGGVAVQSQQQQQAQQQSATRPPGRRGPLPQAPPKRVVTRVQRGGSVPHAATSGSTSRQYNRVITPYNPQLVQQQQMEAQAQQMMAVMQEQQQVAAAAAMAGVSPEMLDEFYAMGSRLGAAFGQGQGEGGSAGGLAQNPAAMAAFMHALYSYGNPTAIAQQVAGVMGGQQ